MAESNEKATRPDVRYFAVSDAGRMRLDAASDAEAEAEVERDQYHRKTARKIIRETREVIKTYSKGARP
ncbi:MAG: hypothetical protein WAP03_21645 [Methylorubrum rhodinum]|uniref:hypothetical protein n=1 Tax=Methylorubrum rhodinum TaxID=29428 RepID=UPI003BAFE69E